MGRIKIGKPHRERRMGFSYSLDQLKPPGACYERWFDVEPGADCSALASDPRVSAGGPDCAKRLVRLAEPYHWRVPWAAILLDRCIDTGFVLRRQNADGLALMSIAAAGDRFDGVRDDPGKARDWMHRLHANGAMLIETEGDVPVVRAVVPPERPGEPWVFMAPPSLPAGQT